MPLVFLNAGFKKMIMILSLSEFETLKDDMKDVKETLSKMGGNIVNEMDTLLELKSFEQGNITAASLQGYMDKSIAGAVVDTLTRQGDLAFFQRVAEQQGSELQACSSETPP